MRGVQLEAESAAQNVVAQIAGSTGFFEGRFKALVGVENFAVDVVVAHADAHGISRDDHAFDHRVGVVLHDVAVFASARLAFVGVAHQILLTGELAGHEAPLQARGETRTAATTQAGLFDRGDHLVLGHARHAGFGVRRRAIFAQDLAQGCITTTRFVIFDAPVAAIQTRIDLRVDVAIMKAAFHAGGLELAQNLFDVHQAASAFFRLSISWSSFSWLMKLHMCRSLTNITGASAQAPWHSLG